MRSRNSIQFSLVDGRNPTTWAITNASCPRVHVSRKQELGTWCSTHVPLNFSFNSIFQWLCRRACGLPACVIHVIQKHFPCGMNLHTWGLDDADCVRMLLSSKRAAQPVLVTTGSQEPASNLTASRMPAELLRHGWLLKCATCPATQRPLLEESPSWFEAM